MKLRASVRTPLLWLQLLASLLAGFFVWYSITDADIFWHLASGREIVAHKSLLYTDTFSFTTVGRRWFNLHWLFQVIMYAIHSAGGTAGLLLGKSIMVASAVWLLISSFKRTHVTVGVAFVLAVTVYFQRYLIPLRPTIMTLLAISVFIAAFERYCVTGKLRYYLFPIGMQIVWVNSQGLYMIGPAIAIVYAAGEWLNRCTTKYRLSLSFYNPAIGFNKMLLLTILPGILLVASLINPYGSNAIAFSFKLLRRITPAASNIYSMNIAENMPLFSMPGTVYEHYPFIIGVLLVVTIIFSCATRRHIRFAHVGLAVMGCALAVMAQRNGILFTFLIFPALLHAAGTLPRFRNKVFTISSYTVSLLVVISVLFATVRHTAFLHDWPHTVSPFSHPVGIVDYIKTHPFSGNIFNADRYGGYLTWNLFPDYKVSSDTRLTLRSDTWFREYMEIISDPRLFDAYARRWDITRVAVPLSPLTLYCPLAKHLYRDPIWKLVYTDGTEALFALRWSDSSMALNMNSVATVGHIAGELQDRFSRSPMVSREAFCRLLQWCALTESFIGAESAYTYCKGSDANLTYAAIKAQQGFTSEAEQMLASEVTAHPVDKKLYMSLIYFYLNNGHPDKALGNLSLLLKKDPFYRPGRELLFRLSEQKGTK